jgi:hypothetical protein
VSTKLAGARFHGLRTRLFATPRLRPASLVLLLVAVQYFAVALGRPSDLFWSPDQGGKFLQVLALLDGRYDLSIPYPGRALDPGFLFQPYVYGYIVDGALQLPWPMAWALPSAVLYAALGGIGLVLLPICGGLLSAWSAGRLADRLAPGSGWLAILLAGLATPIFVYSTLFWEHAPAAGFFSLGLLLSLPDQKRSASLRWLLGGSCFGVAMAWRNETCISLVAAAAAWPIVARAFHRRKLAYIAAGLGLALVPAGMYQWLVTGAVYARTPALPASAPRAIENLVRQAPWLPADLLVGRRDLGLELPETVRWLPAVGLGLLLAGRLVKERWQKLFRLGGLVLAGSATAALLVTPAPHVVRGFLIGAPFLGVILLTSSAVTGSPSGRVLVGFAALALPLYGLTLPMLHLQGVAGGGTEWGPRYLLSAYPPLTAVAAAVLVGLFRSQDRLEQALSAALVARGFAFQLAGLARIDLRLEQLRQDGQLIASLPPGPIVVRPHHLVRTIPRLGQERAVYCVETASALRRWSSLALAAGEEEFWFVDTNGLQPDWLAPHATIPLSLAVVAGDAILAAQYRIDEVRPALRGDRSEPDACWLPRVHVAP